MQFDLGLEGLGYLIGMSLVFGVVAQVVAWKWATHWIWLVGAVAYFVGGLFFSEVLFGSATIDEIQPIIDGLALDESMLGGLIVRSQSSSRPGTSQGAADSSSRRRPEPARPCGRSSRIPQRTSWRPRSARRAADGQAIQGVRRDERPTRPVAVLVSSVCPHVVQG
jgi:hypothetical protein